MPAVDGGRARPRAALLAADDVLASMERKGAGKYTHVAVLACRRNDVLVEVMREGLENERAIHRLAKPTTEDATWRAVEAGEAAARWRACGERAATGRAVRVTFAPRRAYRASVADAGKDSGTWFAAACALASAPTPLPVPRQLENRATRTKAWTTAQNRSHARGGALELWHVQRQAVQSAAAHLARKLGVFLHVSNDPSSDVRLSTLLCADVTLGWLLAWTAMQPFALAWATRSATSVASAVQSGLALVDDYVVWLADAPAGFKQNQELGLLLGVAVLRFTALLRAAAQWAVGDPWRLRIGILFATRGTTLAAICGLSTLVRLAAIVSFSFTMPLLLSFGVMRRLLNAHLLALRRMWALVRHSPGPDGGVVVEKVVAGALLLAPTVLLLPTMATFALAVALPATAAAAAERGITAVLDFVDGVAFASAAERCTATDTAISRNNARAWLEPLGAGDYRLRQ